MGHPHHRQGTTPARKHVQTKAEYGKSRTAEEKENNDNNKEETTPNTSHQHNRIPNTTPIHAAD
jgi:hypothetical protein